MSLADSTLGPERMLRSELLYAASCRPHLLLALALPIVCVVTSSFTSGTSQPGRTSTSATGKHGGHACQGQSASQPTAPTTVLVTTVGNGTATVTGGSPVNGSGASISGSCQRRCEIGTAAYLMIQGHGRPVLPN